MEALPLTDCLDRRTYFADIVRHVAHCNRNWIFSCHRCAVVKMATGGGDKRRLRVVVTRQIVGREIGGVWVRSTPNSLRPKERTYNTLRYQVEILIESVFPDGDDNAYYP